jgi:hypothetical protein
MRRGMTSRMRKHIRKRRWQYARAVLFGLLATAFTVYWPASVQDLYQYTGEHDLAIQVQDAPSYLGDLAPAFTSAWARTPFGKCDGQFMPTPDFGIDVIEYIYGDNDLNWDLERDGDRPPALSLTRYRFGFPMRAAYWDDYGIPSGGTAESLKAYFDQVKQRAGRQMGIEYPGWLFCDAYGRRLPAIPIWNGLIINLLFWSVFWIIPGVVCRTVRTHRRKRRGLCIACGYAVEDLEICPECGARSVHSAGELET